VVGSFQLSAFSFQRSAFSNQQTDSSSNATITHNADFHRKDAKNAKNCIG